MSTIRRISISALLVAGSAFAASASLAQIAQHPAGHPRSGAGPAQSHPAPFRAAQPGFHAGTFHAVRPGFRPGTFRSARPAFRAGTFRAPARFSARFHPLHAIIARHVNFAHFTPAERALWTRGRWQHRWWHGRYGWWWNAGGVWFWYGAPVYPYPTVVSDYYYEEPDPSESGPTWWYCYNPAGYYPYVPSCRGQWTPVPAQGAGPAYGDEQSGADQGPPPDEGQYNRQDEGPPPGYGQAPAGNDEGPPPGYNPPAGDDQGPPPGYDQGPPSGDDQGPPPDDYRYPHNSH
jgi:hypothetical protein